MTAHDNLLTHQLVMNVTFRKLREADLRQLEWYGQYKHFRNLFLRSYHEQQKGLRMMLVADMAGFPIGRIFIQFKGSNPTVSDGQKRAYLYSFAVMSLFQGQGIGTKMLTVAEQLLLRRQYNQASISVAKDNEGALRLYKRHGYQVFGEDPGRWQYVDHRGINRQVNEPCWLLEKNL